MGRFDQMAMTARQLDVSQDVRHRCVEIEKALDKVRECRSKSIALTKLEEAAMWANKAISHVGLRPVHESSESPEAE